VINDRFVFVHLRSILHRQNTGVEVLQPICDIGKMNGEGQNKGGAPVRQCPMCLQMAVPQRTHLLSKGLYKIVRGDDANPHPLHIAPGNWHKSSFQEWVHLLCFDCEQRLHSGGEDWTLKHILRKDGTFKLRDKIIANSKCLSSDSLTVYQVNADAGVDFD
jgi:hypothetical protein